MSSVSFAGVRQDAEPASLISLHSSCLGTYSPRFSQEEQGQNPTSSFGKRERLETK